MAKIGLDLRFWRSATAGLGRYSRNLLIELLKIDQENHYTAIITTADEAEFTLKAANLDLIVTNIPHYSLAEQWQLKTLLNRANFDLVHFANFNHPIGYRGRFVVTIHDLIMNIYPSGASQSSWVRRWAYRQTIRDCQRAQTIIAPSLSTKNDLISQFRFPPGKISVIAEGSEAAFRRHTETEQAAVRKKFGLPEQFLLFVSRWERYKGLPVLLAAYEQLLPRYPDLALVVTGTPSKQNPEVAAAVSAAQTAGRSVVTPGFVSDSDLAALYSAAAVYVHPSLYEGFGIMVLEAMAAGVPVVASQTSSLPEVVGDAGLLVDPNSPADIAEKVSLILSDPKLAADLIERGVKRAGQFSWRTMAEQTRAVYEAALRLGSD